MQFFTAPVEHLIEQFQKLPGIGRKTAQRLAFFVLSLSDTVTYFESLDSPSSSARLTFV